jgi:hypothetical protein
LICSYELLLPTGSTAFAPTTKTKAQTITTSSYACHGIVRSFFTHQANCRLRLITASKDESLDNNKHGRAAKQALKKTKEH